MPDQSIFTGFYKDTVKFFDRLKKHNDKEWFQSHREDYEFFVLAPLHEWLVENKIGFF